MANRTTSAGEPDQYRDTDSKPVVHHKTPQPLHLLMLTQEIKYIGWVESTKPGIFVLCRANENAGLRSEDTANPAYIQISRNNIIICLF
jgi:hypothetical protein